MPKKRELQFYKQKNFFNISKISSRIHGKTGEITLESHLGNIEEINSLITISDPTKVKTLLM